jgi:hypothetical protein
MPLLMQTIPQALYCKIGHGSEIWDIFDQNPINSAGYAPKSPRDMAYDFWHIDCWWLLDAMDRHNFGKTFFVFHEQLSTRTSKETG